DKDGMNFAYIHTFAMADGYNCQAGLVESNGWLVGVAAYGGAHDEGTIFRLKTDGTGFEVMHDFEDPPALDLPFAALTNGGDGFLYGTTYSGGTGGFGGVFRVAPDGSGFKALVDFVGPNGKSPYASLTRIGRGKFLGATQNNTVTDGGLIYRLAMYPDIPTVAVKGKKKLTTSKPSLTLKGTATNAAKVEIKVGKGKYKRAKGTANWSFKLKLKPGKNTITVIAHGPGGDSTPARLTITRK
ncbi:MAG: choice-of-anchor tandem repeat GloVer-containing protein, partial [Chthoniobacterales bacterium]